MRAIVAAAILLVCVVPAATEPEYPSLPAGSSYRDGGSVVRSLVEIESAPIKDDLEKAAAAEVPDLHMQSAASPASAAPAPTSVPSPLALPGRREAQTAPAVPLDQICNALLTSAQDNDLPVAFFANLIWQESRLRDDAVSSKGALGIAQFMPKVAAEAGLADPFDPLQALPASARLLRDLRDQFGNLGFVAAAYNAGTRRVSEWLQRRRTLPRETRGYVIHITGRSVEEWKKAPPADADLQFARRLPCRDVPTFAGLEQAQLQQSEAEQAQTQQTQAQKAPSGAKQPAPEGKAARNARKDEHPKRERIAEHERKHDRSRREPSRTAERERHHRARLEARDRTRTTPHGRHSRV